MFSIARFLRRLAHWTNPLRTTNTDPDQMAFRQWTDLPTHHPLCNGPKDAVA